MEFAVRPATADDAGAAWAVVAAVFEEYGFQLEADGYDADLRELGSHYLAAGHGFWVAERGGEVVGTVALVLYDPPLTGAPGALTDLQGKPRIGGCDCSLERLYVHPDARRGGLGGLLMETCLEEARARGRVRMEIWSDKRFGDAHRLYGRFGAKPVGERVSDDPDRSPEWGLALEL